jgi:hypothetical protein
MPDKSSKRQNPVQTQAMVKKSSSVYRALIIRAWREPGRAPDQGDWCFRIRDLKNGGQCGFASLEALLGFLQHEFDSEESDTNLA